LHLLRSLIGCPYFSCGSLRFLVSTSVSCGPPGSPAVSPGTSLVFLRSLGSPGVHLSLLWSARLSCGLLRFSGRPLTSKAWVQIPSIPLYYYIIQIIGCHLCQLTFRRILASALLTGAAPVALVIRKMRNAERQRGDVFCALCCPSCYNRGCPIDVGKKVQENM